jgi:hypothetical protein
MDIETKLIALGMVAYYRVRIELEARRGSTVLLRDLLGYLEKWETRVARLERRA